NLGDQATSWHMRAARILVILVRVGGCVPIDVGRECYCLNSINPIVPSNRIVGSVIVVVRVGIASARGTLLIEFRVILVGQQPAAVINESLPCAVSQVMCENLTEVGAVGEFFVGSRGICIRWIIDAGNAMVRVASVGGYVLTFVANA